MGQLAGACRLDGGYLDLKELVDAQRTCVRAEERLLGTVGSRIVFAQSGNATVAEEAIPDQNGITGARYACQLDGRLDNSDVLLRKLGVRRASVRDDADLILKLYRARGAEGVLDIIGDWSLVLWDPEERVLLLASDYAGTRPLYFHQGADHFSWSSSLCQLTRHVGSKELDRDFMIESVTRGSSQTLTPYRGIHSVPGGGIVRVSSKDVRTETIWQPPLHAVTRLSSDRDYERSFLELLDEAVAVRLRGSSTVCAELSGGLDSSSIVCVSKRLITSGSVPATNLTTVSYCALGSIDETFRDTVERACQFPHHHIDLASHGFVHPAQCGGARPAWWVPRHSALARTMDHLNTDVLLTGQMGDLVMGNWFDGTEQVSHCLTNGSIGAALRAAVRWSEAEGRPVYPILWGALSSMLPGRSSVLPGEAASGLETSLSAPVAGRAREMQIDRFRGARWRGARPGRGHRLRGLVETLETQALQCPEALQRRTCSHPFSHRPLVEYMMTIPPEIVYKPGEPRRLMRRALAGVVPQEILRRKSKAGYNSIFRQALLPIARSFVADSRQFLLEDQGLVIAESFRKRLVRLEQGLECNEPQLRHLILMELWLRSFHGFGAAMCTEGVCGR